MSPNARCPWAGSDPLYLRYHDDEWGVPSHDDRHLFEMLILEGAQAGLSWITILRKRVAYRKAFDRFDPKRIATYDAKKLRALLADEGIVRNRLKIHGTVQNARAFLALRDQAGSFDAFLWPFVGGAPKQNRWQEKGDSSTHRVACSNRRVGWRYPRVAERNFGCRLLGGGALSRSMP